VGYDERGRQQKSRVYGRTQAEASDKLEKLKARLAEGLPPKPEKQTVAQFLNSWLDTVCPSNVGDRTLRTYRDLAEDHIMPALGRNELSKLSPQHVQRFVRELRKKPKAPRKKNQDAQRSGYLALCLGPREGELLGLQWTDLDFERETVTLVRQLQRIKKVGEKKSHLELLQTKTPDSDRSRWVPKLVLERLLAHRTRQDEERRVAGSAWCETGMVFGTRKGTLLDPRNMLRDYYRLRAKAQLPKIRFHDLRHSAATILKMAGIPDEAIQKLLGHASVRTTQEIYMHLTTAGEKQAAAKMDEILGPVAVKGAAGNRNSGASS